MVPIDGACQFGRAVDGEPILLRESVGDRCRERARRNCRIPQGSQKVHPPQRVLSERRVFSGRAGHRENLARKSGGGRGRVPFFSMSAAEFVEMIVGVGARNAINSTRLPRRWWRARRLTSRRSLKSPGLPRAPILETAMLPAADADGGNAGASREDRNSSRTAYYDRSPHQLCCIHRQRRNGRRLFHRPFAEKFLAPGKRRRAGCVILFHLFIYGDPGFGDLGC